MSLDDLSRVKSRRDRIQDATGKKLDTDETTPDEPESLAEIYADKEKSARFGILLKTRIAQPQLDDIYRRLAAKEELTPSQMFDLNRERYEFAELTKLAEKTKDTFNAEKIKYFTDRHDTLDMFAGQVSPERAAELVHMQISNMVMEDPDGIRKMLTESEKLDAKKKNPEYLRLEREVRAVCDRNKFSSDDIVRVLDIKKVDDRKEALRGMIRGKYGLLQKIFDYGVGGRFSKSEMERGFSILDRTRKEKFMKEIATHTKNIGNILAATTINDPKFMSIFSQEVLGNGKVSQERFESVSSLSELKAKQGTMEANDITGNKWRQEKARLETVHRKKWNTFTSAEKDAGIDDYIDTMEKSSAPEGRGVFVSILAALFKAMFGRIRTDKAKWAI